MQVSVGQALVYKDRTFAITRYDRHQTTRFADCDGEEMRKRQQSCENVRHMDLQVDAFQPNDIIDLDVEVIELVDPGKHIELIYTKYHARRRQDAEREASKNPSS